MKSGNTGGWVRFVDVSLACAGLLAISSIIGCDAGSDGRAGADGGIGAPGEGSGAEDDGDGGDDGADPDGSNSANADGDMPEPPATEVPFDPQQLAKVCARNNGDRVAAALCDGAQLHSIADLRAALDFESPFFALTANSSSLVARDISAINPRLVIGEQVGFFDGTGVESTLAMGFARGDQLVELMSFDPIADELNFYLLKFEQACNDTEEGCSTADLVTPALEENWSRWTLYQDTDLVNTTVDCNVCHQPMGPGTPKVPRIQEISNSWTHWFPVRPATQGGGWSSGGNGTKGIPVEDPGTHGTHSSEVLWNTFERMHGVDGSYGGVSIEEMRSSAAGPDLETFVRNYIMMRQLPAPFAVPGESNDGGSTTDLYCDSPNMEKLGGASDWALDYQRVLAGQRLPVPSHRIDIADEAKREAAIDSYIKVVNGLISPDQLEDPRDVISQEARTEMSLQPRENASAQEILTHMCSRCHNGNLDPSLSRANFDATRLESLSVAQKQLIASRLTMDHTDSRMMPPPRFATLPDWATERVLAWLAP
jgi:hypothetical protein